MYGLSTFRGSCSGGEDGRFLHLTQHRVREDQGGVAVLVRQVERQDREVKHLLDAAGGEGYRVIVPVSAAPRGLIVIALGRLDAHRVRARTASHRRGPRATPCLQ